MYGIGAWFSIDYGDGTTGVASSSPWSCNYWGQPPYAAHAWSRPGRYVITVTAHGSSDCTTPLEDWVTAQTVQTVDVQERHETGSNGPALPRVTWESTDRCRLSLEVVDDDGAIYEELVDWGDGTPTERKQMSGSFVGDTYRAAGGRHIYAQSFPTDLASVTVTIISRGADKQSYQSSPPLRYDVPTRCYPDDYSTG